MAMARSRRETNMSNFNLPPGVGVHDIPGNEKPATIPTRFNPGRFRAWSADKLDRELAFARSLIDSKEPHAVAWLKAIEREHARRLARAEGRTP